MPHKLKIEPNEKNLRIFLEISVQLTGFKADDLLATGMVETYYYTLMKEQDQDNMRAFFREADIILHPEDYVGQERGYLGETGYAGPVKNPGKRTEGDIRAEIARSFIGPNKYQDLAKRIILLWYTSTWTTYRVILETQSYIVSPEAYVQGLMWTAGQTHPPGARQPGYDSWSSVPLGPNPTRKPVGGATANSKITAADMPAGKASGKAASKPATKTAVKAAGKAKSSPAASSKRNSKTSK